MEVAFARMSRATRVARAAKLHVKVRGTRWKDPKEKKTDENEGVGAEVERSTTKGTFRRARRPSASPRLHRTCRRMEDDVLKED